MTAATLQDMSLHQPFAVHTPLAISDLQMLQTIAVGTTAVNINE